MSKSIQNLSRSGRPKGSKNKRYNPQTVIKHLAVIAKSLRFIEEKVEYGETAIKHFLEFQKYANLSVLDENTRRGSLRQMAEVNHLNDRIKLLRSLIGESEKKS